MTYEIIKVAADKTERRHIATIYQQGARKHPKRAIIGTVGGSMAGGLLGGAASNGHPLIIGAGALLGGLSGARLLGGKRELRPVSYLYDK
jgi:uncharacterized protein YcfJ